MWRNGRKVLVAGSPLSVQATILTLTRERDALASELREVKKSWHECRATLKELSEAVLARAAAEAKLAALYRERDAQRGNPHTLH